MPIGWHVVHSNTLLPSAAMPHTSHRSSWISSACDGRCTSMGAERSQCRKSLYVVSVAWNELCCEMESSGNTICTSGYIWFKTSQAHQKIQSEVTTTCQLSMTGWWIFKKVMLTESLILYWSRMHQAPVKNCQMQHTTNEFDETYLLWGQWSLIGLPH